MHSRVHELLNVPGRLRALPLVASDPGGWQAVQQKLARQVRRTQRRAHVARFAAAASLAALGFFAGLKVLETRPADQLATSVASVAAGDSVAKLRARSQALEELLAAMPSRPAVERADTSLPIETLEAQVQWLDHQLSIAGAAREPAPDAEQLWRDRVEVMNSLVELRYVEAQRVVL
jgi:hypothetical protein